MIVRFNKLNLVDSPTLMLCNPGCIYKQDGSLTNVVGALCDYEGEEVIFNFNAESELNFRVNKVRHADETQSQHALKMFESIKNRRLIFMSDIGFFMIMDTTKKISGDNGAYIDVKAESIEVELDDIQLPLIEDGTYRFASDGSSKGIQQIIKSVTPLWTFGTVDNAVAQRWRTFKDVDPETTVRSFLIDKVQEAYECIIVFDIMKRKINVYDRANFVTRTDIHLTKSDIDITESSDDVYTAVRATTDNNLPISWVNPTGSNVIYDFSYYKSWMTPALQTKVSDWMRDIKSAEARYLKLSRQYVDAGTDISRLNGELVTIQAALDIYQRLRDNIVAAMADMTEEQKQTTTKHKSMIKKSNNALKSSGADNSWLISEKKDIESSLQDIKDIISTLDNRWFEKQEQHDRKVEQQETLAARLQLIYYDKLSIESYFDSEEFAELYSYIFECKYQDEYITTTDSMTDAEVFDQVQTLYNRAKDELARVCYPAQEFKVDVDSFIFLKEFQRWSEQLETGCVINVELNDQLPYQDVAQLFLSGITVNYDDHKMSLKFGSRYDRTDTKTLFDKALGKISKSARTLDRLSEAIYPIKNGELTEIRKAIQNARNISMENVLASEDEEIVIDSSGYTGKTKLDNGEYDPRQIKITGKNIVFTDDAWESSKVAIGELFMPNGESTYGINAETVIGELIIGSQLKILDQYGNDAFQVADDKISSFVADYSGALDNVASSVEQTADALTIKFGELRDELSDVTSVETEMGYTFDRNGLRIASSNDNVETTITNEGMFVNKVLQSTDEGVDAITENVLTANDAGVQAYNLHARTYLIIGSHSRLEDYGTDRTACFYVDHPVFDED